MQMPPRWSVYISRHQMSHAHNGVWPLADLFHRPASPGWFFSVLSLTHAQRTKHTRYKSGRRPFLNPCVFHIYQRIQNSNDAFIWRPVGAWSFISIRVSCFYHHQLPRRAAFFHSQWEWWELIFDWWSYTHVSAFLIGGAGPPKPPVIVINSLSSESAVAAAATTS